MISAHYFMQDPVESNLWNKEDHP